MDVLDELKENQWKNKDALTRLQRIKLKRLLAYTYRHVPYYREKFKKTGIDTKDLHRPECFPQIPLLTKEDINKNRDFNYDLRSSVYRRASVIRNQEWLGTGIGDRSARLWGAPMDLKKASKVRGRIHSWINNIMFLSSYDMSNEILETYIKKLNKFKPELLISYPGPLTVFAEYLIESNQKIPSVNAIISSAETLLAWQRDLVEKAFSCLVYNRYGCREFGDVAQECEKREGLHVNVDRVFVEVLDESLQPVEDGRSGELVITDLDNYGMPFIRYRIGDVASFKKETCSCGRGLPLLDHVEGRVLDVVRAPNGNRLGGTFWTILFKSRPGIKSFQVVQDRLEGITVKYIKNPEVSSIDFAALNKRIQEKCGEDFKIDFEDVSSIPKTSSGKTRIVVSKLKELE